MWRRACEAGVDVFHYVMRNVLNLSTADLLASIMQWYEAHMKERRLHAWHSGVLAIDGNAKLYRRTCGAAGAQSVYSSRECSAQHMVDTLTGSGYYGLHVQLTGFEPWCVAGVFRKTWW